MATHRAKDFVLIPSDIARAEKCAAARVLVSKRERPGYGQWWGIFIHRFLEKAVKHGRQAGLDYIDERCRMRGLADRVRKIDLDRIPTNGTAESTHIIHTDRFHSFVGHKNDADPLLHFTAKDDLFFFDDASKAPGWRADTRGLWHIIDYKCVAKNSKYHPRPDDDQQTTLSLALWMEKGMPDKGVASSIVVINGDGEHWLSWVFAPEDLLSHHLRMRRVHLQVLNTRWEFRDEGLELEYSPGDHCRGCRAETGCPGLQKRL